MAFTFPDLFWFGVWYTQHNNIRYAELLPRLRDRIEMRRLLWPHHRYALRAYALLERHLFWPHVYPRLMRRWARRYRAMFCTRPRLASIFPGDVLVDVDDPSLREREMTWLNQANVRVVVTTTELLRAKLEERGLRPPCVVIPSGVNLAQFTSALSTRASDAPLAACFVAPMLYTAAETVPGSETHSLRTVDFLFEAMALVWQQRPDLRLLLVGKPSPGVQTLARRHPQVQLLGYIPHARIAEVYARAHIGLYPRLGDFGGRHSIKIVEYLAAGLPVVSTRVSEAFYVEEARAGFLAEDAVAFAEAILRLAEDASLRAAMAERGRRYARQFDWDVLAERYRRDVLEVYLR